MSVLLFEMFTDQIAPEIVIKISPRGMDMIVAAVMKLDHVVVGLNSIGKYVVRLI